MTEAALTAVLYYYLLFWLLNTSAYLIVSVGIYRWLEFAKGLSAEPIIRVTFKVTLTFAIARGTIGLVGISLFELGTLPPLHTIIVLGMTSLFLNTAFIMTEGFFLNREANLVMAMPPEMQTDLKTAWETADRLRRTLDAT